MTEETKENTYRDIEILNESCMIGLEKMKKDNKLVHLTVTSPPYFNVKEYVYYNSYREYLEMLKKVFTMVYDVTFDGRICGVNLSNIILKRPNRQGESVRLPIAFHFVPLMEKIGWKFLEDIVWVKPDGSSKNRNGGFFQHRQPVAYKPNVVNEYILIFQKPSNFLIDKIVRSYDGLTSYNSKVQGDYERTNVWQLNPETKSEHPAPYPETITDKIISYYSFCGDLVLDPFAGSGTTLVSAYKLNRSGIGFEIHQEYIEIFRKRLPDVKRVLLKTSIDFNNNDYKGMTPDEIKTKINQNYDKKMLIAMIDETPKINTYKKTDLVHLVFTKYFDAA